MWDSFLFMRHPSKAKSSKALFLFIFMFMFASCSSEMLRCTRPDPPALLEALKPVFNLSTIRPVIDISTPTNVTIDLVLIGILGVDEKAQVLTTYVYQLFQWQNEFVRWDPEECGTEFFSVPRKLMWIPDVLINEFMEKNTAPFIPYLYLSHDGKVADQQPVRIVSSCRLDIYTFPFDIQNCSFTFNSYLHPSTDLTINQNLPVHTLFTISKDVMAIFGEWELIEIAAAKRLLLNGDGEYYEELRFFIIIKRQATMYVVNLLLPSCFLITVDLFSFLLPPISVDRSLFQMTLILGYTVFLVIMNDLLPITAHTIPLINVFLSLCLALMVASLLETLLITNLLHRSAHTSPLPPWVRFLVFHILGRLVFFSPKQGGLALIQSPAQQEMNVWTVEEEVSKVPLQKGPLLQDKALQELRNLARELSAIRLQVEQQINATQSSEEWVWLGVIIDRLLFGLYILFISVSFIIVINIWINFYNSS